MSTDNKYSPDSPDSDAKAAWYLSFVLLLCIVSLSASAQTDMRLIDAAKSQDWAGVRSLLNEKDININATQADGATAMAFATYWDNIESVQKLLDAGADPNIGNDYGVTPLMLANENRSATMVKTLLEGNADPNVAMWSGETLLMSAARTGFAESIQMLLENGAEINTREPRRGQSALMWAISFGYPDIARILIEHGADINAKTIMLNEEFTPMELEGYSGSTIRAVPLGGYTPLLFAAMVGDVVTARLLVELGADVNAESESDGSPLIMAAALGHEDLAVYLLGKGADPNAVDVNGMTALHYALRDGIKILHGIIITDKTMVCNFANEDFLCKPLEVLNEEQLAYMKVPNVDVYVVKPGFKYGNDTDKSMPGNNMHKLIGALLASGANPNAKMKYPPEALRLDVNPWFTLRNATPFLLAAAAQDTVAAAMLLEEGANPIVNTEIDKDIFIKQVNFPAEDNMVVGNATSLMAAVGLGRRSDMTIDEQDNALLIAKRLINLGADINAATETGWTALHAAAFIGATSLVRLLVEAGAKIDVMNGCGQTPMGLALANDSTGLLDRTLPRPETAEMLLELGAGENPPTGPLGVCVPGRGGLAADATRFREKVKVRLKPVNEELERRKQKWRDEAMVNEKVIPNA
ncbi:MAG: ankyrin repeat domain-containing protein [Gammaproteobacteria bacterium]|jgi:ankyrin repeat protein